MGTSTKLPGPVGGSWSASKSALTRSLTKIERTVPAPVQATTASSSQGGGASTAAGETALGQSERWRDVEAPRHGEAFLQALESELRADVDAFSLVETSSHAGDRLVGSLETLGRDGPSALGPLTGATAEERVELFLARFVAQTAGEGGALADAVARRAATHAAEVLLDKHAVLRHEVETGTKTARASISDGLFCEIYRLFFADMVTQFLTAVIAGKISLAVPVLPILDPAGHIADWLAEKVVAMIPTPCDEKQSGDGRSAVELGRELAQEALLRAVGIEDGNA